MKKPSVLAAALAASMSAGAFAQPTERCTHETLRIRGVPLAVTICASPAAAARGHELPMRLAETFAGPRGTVNRQTVSTFIAEEPASRVLEDVPLAATGIAGTLHLTLVLHGGSVAIDAAMLTPGAVTVK